MFSSGETPRQPWSFTLYWYSGFDKPLAANHPQESVWPQTTNGEYDSS